MEGERTSDTPADAMDRELQASERIRAGARQWVVWSLFAIIAALALPWLVGMLEPSVKRSRIRIGEVQRGPLEAVLTASGIVQPAREEIISSQVEGRVLRVVSQPGTLLEAGDPILELDVGQATLELRRLEGEREQRRSERRELQLKLEERLIDLRSQAEVRQLDIEELDYQVEQDQRLFDEGLISESQLRATLVRRRKAEIELRKVGESVDNGRASLAAQISSLDARLGTLGRELASARRRAEMAVTRADRAGVLTYVFDEVGAAVRAGDVLVRIADPNRFRVEATISDVHARRLAEGQSIRVAIGDEKLAGQISRILPAIDEGALRFLVELGDPSDPLLRANLRADVLVVVDQRPSALMVPKGPAIDGVGRQRLFVLRDGLAIRREVEVGLSGYRHYEVLEGLEAGDVVILSDMTRYLEMEEIKVRG